MAIAAILNAVRAKHGPRRSAGKQMRFRRVEDHLITTRSGRLLWRRGHWARIPDRVSRDAAAIRDLFD